MLDYLTKTLGLSASVESWPEAERLPLYLQNGKKYSFLYIEDVKCLLVEVDENGFSLPAFRKQMAKLLPQPEFIVLCFKHLNSRQRKALIEARMPFIVPGSQIYLPFIGIVLQERMKSVVTAPKKLSPGAQLILLLLIYEPVGSPFRKIDLAKQLDMSAMTVTRAVQELTALELVCVDRKGRNDWVITKEGGRSLYEKALPYLIDPVQKRICVRRNKAFSGLLMAGEYALGSRTLLNGPDVECRAISRKEFKRIEGIEEVDPAWTNTQDYVQLEVWKYDPKPLAFHGAVDVISLALSLRDVKDERVEQAVEEMLEDTYGKRLQLFPEEVRRI